MRRVVLPFLLTILVLAPVVLAQRSPDAETLFQEALSTAQEAREAYEDVEIYTFDQPLWREAITLGERALESAPEDPEITRFLARAYSYVNWHVRAWDHWLSYLGMGGVLEDPADFSEQEVPSWEQFSEAGTELGYARYIAGDEQVAVSYYEAVATQLPDFEEALTWLGRIHFEQGRPAEALPYWEQLSKLEPGDSGVQYYLSRTQERLAVGVEASDTFQEGIVAYEGGRYEEALGQFENALGFNSTFIQAAVWAGRTSLELGLPDRAKRHWEHVLSMSPGDSRAAYFLGVTEAQITWGVEAAKAFFDGQSHYGQGDLAAAAANFASAVEINSEYLEAWVWAARTYQELGQPVDAITYWQGVLGIDPQYQRARYNLNLARQEMVYGVEAARAFAAAVENYQLAQIDEAEVLFKQAVEANPGFSEAYGWLGRLFFSRSEYEQASRYYQRALELEPENEDYRFFAEESERLIGG
jgi:tetratricopeptide (TPR) repeat protein